MIITSFTLHESDIVRSAIKKKPWNYLKIENQHVFGGIILLLFVLAVFVCCFGMSASLRVQPAQIRGEVFRGAANERILTRNSC